MDISCWARPIVCQQQWDYFTYYYYHYNIFLNVWIFCYIIGCLSLNISGCVDVDITSRLYSDLCEAQLALSVQNYLHLIYLITPYDLVAHITPDWSVMFNLVSVTYSCLGTQSSKCCKICNKQNFFNFARSCFPSDGMRVTPGMRNVNLNS